MLKVIWFFIPLESQKIQFLNFLDANYGIISLFGQPFEYQTSLVFGSPCSASNVYTLQKLRLQINSRGNM